MNMYFAALVAPDDIDQQVLEWKKWMKERYLCEAALRSPAHITLVAPFWMDPDLEESLMDSITAFSGSQASPLIQLNHFSHFKSRVIFIDVVPNDHLAGLQQQLIEFLFNTGRYPVVKEERAFHPHVTIATRDLHKKDYYEAWEHFKDRRYEAGWQANGISLLMHNKKNWEVIATSQFKKG